MVPVGQWSAAALQASYSFSAPEHARWRHSQRSSMAQQWVSGVLLHSAEVSGTRLSVSVQMHPAVVETHATASHAQRSAAPGQPAGAQQRARGNVRVAQSSSVAAPSVWQLHASAGARNDSSQRVVLVPLFGEQKPAQLVVVHVATGEEGRRAHASSPAAAHCSSTVSTPAGSSRQIASIALWQRSFRQAPHAVSAPRKPQCAPPLVGETSSTHDAAPDAKSIAPRRR